MCQCVGSRAKWSRLTRLTAAVGMASSSVKARAEPRAEPSAEPLELKSLTGDLLWREYFEVS